MKYLKISIGIFVVLAVSRFVPHPPNFTSLLALSFYVPVFLGLSYLPVLLVGFIFTDLIIGLHGVTIFTWGSVILIGLGSRLFDKGILNRICGSLLGACLFFIITNFGVWSLGSYGYSINGMISCYILALPFFGYSLISTFIFAGVIEGVYKYINFKKFISLKKSR
ncbi:hypothetical protein IDH30_02595 [Pelagibacterales bacterium SAG-MED15]|nr:hypothetical protein [Pelagibacterales bacterium SAG-MED15]